MVELAKKTAGPMRAFQRENILDAEEIRPSLRAPIKKRKKFAFESLTFQISIDPMLVKIILVAPRARGTDESPRHGRYKFI